jgi:hypothetical protein
MCGCFVVALGAFFPRIALVLIWIFTNWVQRAFSGEWILPLLGILLVPYTTLAYVALYAWLGEVTGFTWFFVVLAFLLDLGSWASGAQAGRERYAA